MNIVSIHTGHGASIVFYYKNKYYTIEAERVFKKRYIGLYTQRTHVAEDMVDYMLKLAKDKWGIENDFDICTHTNLSKGVPETAITANKACIDRIKAKKYVGVDHHLSHAANAFYMSPFQEALIVSADGSGNDGVFNIYAGDKEKGIVLLKKLNVSSFGKAYRRPAYVLSDIRKITHHGNLTHQLSYPGKLMGLSAYGKVKREWIEDFIEYYNHGKIVTLGDKIGINFISDKAHKNYAAINQDDAIYSTYNGGIAYDIAATNQMAFELAFTKLISPLLDEDKTIPICLAGGCALNVLLNERLRRLRYDKIFISPNPDDSGLALGHNFYINPPKEDEIKNIVYTGIPILDIDELDQYVEKYNAKKVSTKDLVPLLKKGDIIGVCVGNSEIGPRALGNRSIICDPSFDYMKDKINGIKKREWYRPFAPMVRFEDREEYFTFSHESEFMSYAPIVKDEWRDKLPAITHVDGTARLQTVKKEQHEFMYSLLTEFGGVLLNTSFNINGLPILSTIQDAIRVLEETTLDHVYIEGYLFSK